MKTSTQIVLAAAFVGSLSLGVQLRTVYAIKPQAHEAIMPQTHSSNQVAEASDGDGEENDATEAPELIKPHSRSTSSIPIKVQEANNGIGRQNDAKKVPERTVTNSGSNKQDDGGFDAPNDADSVREDAH